MTRRTLAALAAATCLLLVGAGAALAHVDLEPGEAVAGSTTTLTFSFRHGKDGSATTGLEVLLPPGSLAVEAPPVPGWTAEIGEAGTVTWSGGRVPDGTEAAFPLVVQLPPEPGVALFKTIQVTEAGELPWIQEEEGEAEGSYPAPRLTLVPDPNPTTTAPTTSTSAPGTTETTEDRPGTTLEAQARDDGGSPAPWLIGSGIAAALMVGIGGMLLKRRAGG